MPVAAATVGRERHALTGPSVRLDPRFYPVRSDLTDVRLADRVFAPHYAEALLQTALTITPVRSGPAADAAVLSELLPGEPFELFEASGTIAWGRSLVDGIVGYVDTAVLGDHAVPTHRVVQQPALLHEAPDHNAATLAALPLGSRIASLGERGDYLLTAGGYVARSAVLPLDQPLPGGPVAAATMLVGTPRREGGRSGAGVDPHGLIFLAHELAGIAMPRLGDMLAPMLTSVGAPPRAGDVVLLGAQPAILVEADAVVHLLDGQVVREPLAAAIAAHGPLNIAGAL